MHTLLTPTLLILLKSLWFVQLQSKHSIWLIEESTLNYVSTLDLAAWLAREKSKSVNGMSMCSLTNEV